MKFKLNQLAGTKTGLVLNRKKASLQSNYKRDYNVVSLKSFSDSGVYLPNYAEEFIANEDIKEDFIVKKGDILLRLREPNFAVYIEKDYDDLIISSLVAVVRVNSDYILPEYLAYYLNSNPVKMQLLQDITTTAIRMIKLIDINNLEISVPSIERQKIIIKTISTFNKEEVLLQDLITEKKKLKNAILETINKEDK